jgi:SAM-dependent methyltransferase
VTVSRYALDNHHPVAVDHHQALAELLDPFSFQRTLDLLDPDGERCLEIGAGGGSYAVWLAEQVGPDGEVVAVDIKPDLMLYRSLPSNLQIRAMDITDTSQLRGRLGDGWQLIHARLTLGHLPAREAILRSLAELLAVGGTLLVEDWYSINTDTVMAAPDAAAAAAYTRFQRVQGRAFESSGTDRTWARRVYPVMVEAGLIEVHTEIHATAWAGGTPGCRLMASSMAQLRPQLLAAGLSEEDLDRAGALLRDPGLVVAGHPLYSTSGRRPKLIHPTN